MFWFQLNHLPYKNKVEFWKCKADNDVQRHYRKAAHRLKIRPTLIKRVHMNPNQNVPDDHRTQQNKFYAGHGPAIWPGSTDFII